MKMCLVPDLVEEILLKLPLKSIWRFKAVSKEWRSILESRRFAERRMMNMKVPEKLKIMAADVFDRDNGRFEGDEEVDMLYLHCDFASLPSLSCDGLLCIPVPGWIYVLNPSTGEFLRFSSGRDPRMINSLQGIDAMFDVFPGYWTMGFGRDKVNGSYKVVRMLFDEDFENRYCQILDVNVGEWRDLSPPPYYMGYRNKSACVNGSIYWLQVFSSCKILAFDLHTEEFRDVPTPPRSQVYEKSGQLANIDDRLVLAVTYASADFHWNVKIWSMDAHKETWSVTYSISLFPREMSIINRPLWFWTRPIAVSKRGHLFFHDNETRLFKYYPETEEVRIIDQNICVICPFFENLFPLRRSDSIPKIRTYGFQNLDYKPSSFQISNFLRRLESPNILLTTAAVALVALVLFY